MAEKIISEIKDKAEKKDSVLEEKVHHVFLDPSTPSNWAVVRVVLITLLILFVAGFVQNIIASLTHLFFLIVLSVFFAYLIDPLVNLIRHPFELRHRETLMPRSLAIVLAYLIVFTVLGVAIASLAPLVSDQAKEFATNMPGYAKSIQAQLTDISRRYQRYQIPEQVQTQITEKASSVAGEVGSQITGFLISLVSYLPWLILIPILAFFFLKDVNLFRLSVLRIFPSGTWRARIESVLSDVNKTLRAYARAQMISCVLIGFICTVGFYVLGIKYALLLGILAGVFEFVPLIGPITIGITTTIVAGFSGSPWQALWTAIFLVVLRILQDYVFYPRIVREGIHLHPLAIILSVLAGEQVAGIPGVFLSIPIVALLTVLYKHILEHSGSTRLFAGWLEPKAVSEEVK